MYELKRYTSSMCMHAAYSMCIRYDTICVYDRCIYTRLTFEGSHGLDKAITGAE